MSDPMTVAFISAGSALLATLLTIFLTPRLQHHFWLYQRRAELRLSVINGVNKLLAEFITGYMEAENKDEKFRPVEAFLQALEIVAAQLKALFSNQAFEQYKKVEVMIPGLTPGDKRTIGDFIQARDAVLRVLYKEVGLL